MLEMLAVIAPMFVIILLGFAAGFLHRFRDAGTHLNAFVFYFALPTFIYTAMVSSPPIGGVPLAAFIIPVTVTPALSIVVYYLCLGLGRRARTNAAPASLAGTFGNVGYFGIPISIGVIGPEAGLAAGIVHMVHNIFFMNAYPLMRTAVASPSEAEVAATRGGWLWRQRIWPIIKRAVLLNPMFVSIAVALVVVFTPLQMPRLIEQPAAMLGNTAVPLALFCVGLALHPALEGVRSRGVPVAPIALGTLAKLVALPVLTWAAVLPFYDHLGPVWAGSLIILAATPSSTTVFLFSEEFDGDGRMAAAILVASTGLSLITLPLVAEILL